MERVKTYCMSPRVKTEPIPNTYRFSRDAGHTNIQRLCYWILDKIGHGTAYYEKVTYISTEINFDNLIEELCKQEGTLYQMTRNPKGYLVVGRNYQHRVYSGELNYFFHINFPSDFEASVYPRENRFMFKGYPIIFVPWIEGMFILPELK